MKTESRHTPGPWRVGDAGHTVFGPPNGNPSPETIANVRGRSNARLIAAAPEMLEALKSIADGIVMDQSKPYDHIDTVLAYQKLARAAIAKATGEK